MAVELKYDEELDQYLIGADVDDVFVAFVTTEGAHVRNRVEAVKASRGTETSSPATDATPATPPAETTPSDATPAMEPDGDELAVPAEGVAP